ncbi:MAG: transcriptional regulator, Fis family [Frankiales bacterium]|nr:transcriptional regulator, Fis family [Frankiales bacterium]
MTEVSVADGTVPGMAALTDLQADVLAFERSWWKHAGSKESAIRDRFTLTSTRYYQLLNALIDLPEALAADPMTVKRLQRLRAQRQATRAARRLGASIR